MPPKADAGSLTGALTSTLDGSAPQASGTSTTKSQARSSIAVPTAAPVPDSGTTSRNRGLGDGGDSPRADRGPLAKKKADDPPAGDESGNGRGDRGEADHGSGHGGETESKSTSGMDRSSVGSAVNGLLGGSGS